MCRRVALPDGSHAIVCGRSLAPRPKRCAYCAQPVVVLCDHPTAPGKTCDRGVCDTHSLNIGLGSDLCWHHARERQEAARSEMEVSS